MNENNEINELVLAANLMIDHINQLTNLLVYNDDTKQAHCNVCGGVSEGGKTARGWIDIQHIPECKYNRLVQALKPFALIWSQYMNRQWNNAIHGSDD